MEAPLVPQLNPSSKAEKMFPPQAQLTPAWLLFAQAQISMHSLPQPTFRQSPRPTGFVI